MLEHGTEGCNYLLAVDIDMNTVDGYAISSWERGYGDLEFVLDLRTIRLLPHQPGAAMVQCDLVWLDHSPVRQSPRTILQTQLDRVAERGLRRAGRDRAGVHRASTPATRTPANAALPRPGAGQRSTTSTTRSWAAARAEPLLREIRNTMYAAGLDVESAKGECNFGQHEIGFLYADALTTADNHAVYKTVAKEIAAQQGQSITFMAKYDEREGNSCHIHLSLRGADGSTGVLERPRA